MLSHWEVAMPLAFVTLEAGWDKVDTQISVRLASYSSDMNAHSSLKKYCYSGSAGGQAAWLEDLPLEMQAVCAFVHVHKALLQDSSVTDSR